MVTGGGALMAKKMITASVSDAHAVYESEYEYLERLGLLTDAEIKV